MPKSIQIYSAYAFSSTDSVHRCNHISIKTCIYSLHTQYSRASTKTLSRCRIIAQPEMNREIQGVTTEYYLTNYTTTRVERVKFTIRERVSRLLHITYILINARH